MITDIRFIASEYQADRTLQEIPYRFVGGLDSGWKIERQGQPWLSLGPGYVPVRTRYCGICATDLMRHQLPFALPQVGGHEIIGEYDQQIVAVEINASHLARNVHSNDCIYCNNQLDTHCPERMTLGIDRLPGGFSPWILAPVRSLYPVPESISPLAAVLLEPFAAALRAVDMSLPQTHDKVAVLGPRRLGMLLIAALASVRQLAQLDFEISAVMRHDDLRQIAIELGADNVVILDPENYAAVEQQFDLVFDTTGSISGLELAMRMARRTLHVKSTNGSAALGLESLTTMVINEQMLAGYSKQTLQQLLSDCLNPPGFRRIFVSPEVTPEIEQEVFSIINGREADMVQRSIRNEPDTQFDIAVACSAEEINTLTRAVTAQGQNWLHPRAVILLPARAFASDASELLQRISRQSLQLVTSRCGKFARAIEILQQCPELAARLQNTLLSRTMPLSQLAEAMSLAADSKKSIKIIIKTS